jgi:hypothetical protein
VGRVAFAPALHLTTASVGCRTHHVWGMRSVRNLVWTALEAAGTDATGRHLYHPDQQPPTTTQIATARAQARAGSPARRS